MLQKILPVICIIALCAFFTNNPIIAQSKTPKYEVGAQFSLLRFSDLDLDRGVTEPGFGGRFTYNINEHIAVEAEMNLFPRDRRIPEDPRAPGGFLGFGGTNLQGGRKLQGLFGIKAGARNKRLGVFAKARPGFVRFSNFERETFACLPEVPCPAVVPRGSETDFALDVGGVVEIYPSHQTVVRFDLGDTIIHSGSDQVVLLVGTTQSPRGPFRFPTGVTRSTSHNLQFSIGFGFRF